MSVGTSNCRTRSFSLASCVCVRERDRIKGKSHGKSGFERLSVELSLLLGDSSQAESNLKAHCGVGADSSYL